MTTMKTYQADSITTASPGQLVLMMYEGVLTAMRRATVAGTPETLDEATFDKELDRAVRILAEMRGVLDHERGGEIATNLDSLYTFCIEVIADAVEAGAIEPLETVSEIVGTLRDAWTDAVMAA
jgi:flagellar secretion chaperone FliS